MSELARLAEADPLFLATTHRVVDVLDDASCAEATDWWLEMTGRSGEGMVVKPLDFIVRGSHGVVQPAVKCRGREYLRIIYGPDYTEPGTWSACASAAYRESARWPCASLRWAWKVLERFVVRRAALAGASGGLWRAGAGKRAGGPPAVTRLRIPLRR